MDFSLCVQRSLDLFLAQMKEKEAHEIGKSETEMYIMYNKTAIDDAELSFCS